MIFRDAWILALIPLYFLLLFVLRRGYKEPGFIFPGGEIAGSLKSTIKARLARKIFFLRVLAAVLIIIAAARPAAEKTGMSKKEGIAIVLAVDCSSTMTVSDVKLGFEDLARKEGKGHKKIISRIDAVKEVARDFIKGRQDDIIGVVAFAASAFIVSPPTFDREWLDQSVERIEIGMIKDGTAIGSGILSSLNSLRDIKAKSKVIVLLTDGINNFGRVPPQVASQAARAMGVKIYTIGVVGSGDSLKEASDGSGRKVFQGSSIPIDEAELKKIARVTGGEYFRAEDMKTLRESYSEIDKLEKAGIEEKNYGEYSDIFSYFVYAALALLLIVVIAENTVFRKIP